MNYVISSVGVYCDLHGWFSEVFWIQSGIAVSSYYGYSVWKEMAVMVIYFLTPC